jgi:hypothetical protein
MSPIRWQLRRLAAHLWLTGPATVWSPSARPTTFDRGDYSSCPTGGCTPRPGLVGRG